MADFEDGIIRMYAPFAEYGITSMEVKAAVKCLQREKGKSSTPTHEEICVFLHEYIFFRRVIRAIKTGEAIMKIEPTEQGKKNATLIYEINKIKIGQEGR